MKNKLLKKIKNRDAVVGVIGLGYVGLPLVMEFSKERFAVVCLDIDEKKVRQLNKGLSYIHHIPSSSVQKYITKNKRVDVSSDFRLVNKCDAVIICVPTPLNRRREPDLSYIIKTARQMAGHVKKGQLIVLESTTYPGTTEEAMGPILEKRSGLKMGKDFYLAFSPEREDPNNAQYSTSTIPKVVGGCNKDSLTVARALYDSVICRTVPVSNCRTAEATKLMENIFRCVNIALVNELKVVFEKMGIDIWEVVRSASTKPFGYMPFYPGPGLGGHCIPIDPFYLSWKAKQSGIETRFIELAGEINTAMPDYVVERTKSALKERKKSLRGSRVLIVGLAYKQNVDDDRESPAYILWKKFAAKGARVSYYDPYCPVIRPSREHSDLAGIRSVKWSGIKGKFDVAVISTAHDNVRHDRLKSVVPLVVDARGVCRPGRNIIKA